MTFYTPKTRKIVEVLNDLVRIHNDRITVYQQALEQLVSIDTDLHDDFERIIANAQLYGQQLQQKVYEQNDNAKSFATAPMFGRIYRAWADLKSSFSGVNQKAAIAFSQYNEEVALHAYRAALDTSVEMSADIKQMIERQETELRKGYEKIKKYREARHTIDHRTLYFT